MTMSSEMALRPGMNLLVRSAHTGTPKRTTRMSTAALPKVKLSILRIALAMFSNSCAFTFVPLPLWNFCVWGKTRRKMNEKSALLLYGAAVCLNTTSKSTTSFSGFDCKGKDSAKQNKIDYALS